MAKLGEIMHRKFLYFDPHDKASAAAHAMHAHHIEYAPLLAKGKFAGIIRASRLARMVLKAKPFGKNEIWNAKKAGNVQVGDMAEKFVRTLKVSDELPEAIAAFAMTGCSQIYVLDNHRKVMGMVQAKDIMGYVGRAMTSKTDHPVKIAQQELESTHRQSTTIDEVLRFVRKSGVTTVDEISKKLNLTSAEVEEYADVLQRSGYIKIDYGILGMAKLRGTDKVK